MMKKILVVCFSVAIVAVALVSFNHAQTPPAGTYYEPNVSIPSSNLAPAQLQLLPQTTTQLSVLVAISTGAEVWDTLYNAPAYSTGIAPGAWVLGKSTSTTAPYVPAWP